MTVANVVMFEFDTPEELKGWAQQYSKSGPFPNNIISLFVTTGDTSAIGINTYPDEEARAAADKPNATELTIGILAVIAQDEAKRISDRVTRALAAAKARGQVLGAYDKNDKSKFIGRTGTKEDCIKAVTAKSQYANAKAENYKPLFDRLNPDGQMSMNAMAQALNAEEIPTPSGRGKWQNVTVKRIYDRLAALPPPVEIRSCCC